MATRVSELRRLELEYGIAQLRQLGRRFCRLEHEPFGQEGQMIRINAPIVAVMPIKKWNAKQIAR